MFLPASGLVTPALFPPSLQLHSASGMTVVASSAGADPAAALLTSIYDTFEDYEDGQCAPLDAAKLASMAQVTDLFLSFVRSPWASSNPSLLGSCDGDVTTTTGRESLRLLQLGPTANPPYAKGCRPATWTSGPDDWTQPKGEPKAPYTQPSATTQCCRVHPLHTTTQTLCNHPVLQSPPPTHNHPDPLQPPSAA